MTTEPVDLQELRAELEDMQDQRDIAFRRLRFTEQENGALHREVEDRNARLEQAWAAVDQLLEIVHWWEEAHADLQAALAEEQAERAALVRHEVERELGREPKRRGRPPSWRPEAEDEVARLHHDGLSVRQIAAALHASKTQVHRVVARVRRQQAEAAEAGRLRAISEGRAPAQRKARASRAKAEQEMARLPERKVAERRPAP